MMIPGAGQFVLVPQESENCKNKDSSSVKQTQEEVHYLGRTDLNYQEGFFFNLLTNWKFQLRIRLWGIR